MRPHASATVHVEPLGDELCLYDWRRHQVHALNPTAARIWQMCDGQTTDAEMAARLAPDVGAEHAAALVRLALAEFREKQLLVEDEAAATGSLSRRDLIKRVGLAAAALPVVTSIVAPTALDAASVVVTHGSQTFTYTGAQQTFTVPPGISALTITAHGAQGGNGTNGVIIHGAAGLGGTITATISVTSGATLYVYVGGAGGNGNASGAAGTAGFNGGGTGTAGSYNTGGGGGGASDVRLGGATPADRVIVAGGGGGGGSGTSGGAGGAGGGSVGGLGGPGSGSVGGGGGGQTAGGAGGTNSSNSGTTGGVGTFGSGGNGAYAGSDVTGGGAGGGGYYGGGGGAGSGFATAGGGGGGGSSYYPSTATSVTNTQGGHSGNGQVTISW